MDKIEVDELGLTQLTAKELDVIAYLAHGYSAKETAQVLGVQTRTIHQHRHNIYSKLNIENELKLAAWFWKGGYKDLKKLLHKFNQKFSD